MGRPREFNEEEVLNGAITLFGTQGFDAVSVDTVVTRLGLNRSSFYKIYGSKHGLLRMALEHTCSNAESGRVGEHCKDLVVVALVEAAPISNELRDLTLRAATLCFDSEAALGEHLVSRARHLTQQGERP